MEIKFEAVFPAKLQYLFRPSRYKVCYGGRGGGRTWGFARALLWYALNGKERILCTREYQNSIEESVHFTLKDQISRLGLDPVFQIQKRSIKSLNGSEFIFAGLHSDPHTIKSTEGITRCWVEEAEHVSQNSWKMLIPTIREPGSEIWVGFNPDLESDPTYQMFLKNPHPDAVVQKLNWRDNPWFPEVLLRERDHMQATDLDAYYHVWEGECRKSSAAQIFAGKCVSQFWETQPHWDGPYLGSDLGFSQDPTTLVECWIDGATLYARELVYEIGLDIDRMMEPFAVAGGHNIRMDNSRPETISYLKRQGLNVVPCLKGPGSVEDGIAFLRGFEKIVIHSDSRHLQEEARLYCYKVDRLSGNVLTEIVDAHNHLWDPIRYALEPVMKNSPNLRRDWS